MRALVVFLVLLCAACGSAKLSAGDGGPDGGLDGAPAADAGANADARPSPDAAPSDASPPPDGSVGPTDAGGPITTHPTNILNNGGFEYGLMCYSNWVWSQTGIDYRGDYDFLLSTDAHSGSYALEIRCTGTDCGSGGKAAIYSQHISTPPGQAYHLTAWAKCDAGQRSFFYTPDSDAGDFFQNLTCNGTWTQNDVDFSVGSSTHQMLLYFYNAGTTSLFLDDVVLTYADGTVPTHTVLHPGTRDVTTSGTTVSVDGSPYLALGFYNVPYSDLGALHDMGGNTVTTLGTTAVSDCFNTEQEPYPDHAYDLGVNIAPDSTTTARLDTPDVYPAVMDRFAPHLANVAWDLVDEPDQMNVSWYYIMASTLVSEHDQARMHTSLPLIADLQRADWADPSVIAPYMPATDIAMAEPYGDNFSNVAHALTSFQGLGTEPVWLAQDAASANVIVPKAYYAVIEGATGILYFTWQDFQGDSAKMAAAGQAFSELNMLKPVIFDADVTSTVTPPSGVSAIARSHGGHTYILAVDPTSTPVSGDFTVSGLTAGTTVTVMFESRTITAADGHFTDSFAGVARHVYRIE